MKKLFTLILFIFSYFLLSAQTETKTETMKVLTATANTLTSYSKSLSEKNNGIIEEPLKSELIKTIGAIQSTRTAIQSSTPAEIEKKKNKIDPIISRVASESEKIKESQDLNKSDMCINSILLDIEKLYKEVAGKRLK